MARPVARSRHARRPRRELDGPQGVRIVDVPEPRPAADQLLVEVHALWIGFPDLLQTRGLYQLKPELPFQLGVDFAGVVREAPRGRVQHCR